MGEKTIFARIIDREIPANIVYEDERCLAFRDINPGAPTHILVVPKKAIDRVHNMGAEDKELIGHLFWAAARVAEKEGVSEAYRLVINNGAGAGQSVFHLHLHLLAGRSLGWPPG